MLTGTAVYGTVRTVVWEDGGSNPASYPIAGKEGNSEKVLGDKRTKKKGKGRWIEGEEGSKLAKSI